MRINGNLSCKKINAVAPKILSNPLQIPYIYGIINLNFAERGDEK